MKETNLLGVVRSEYQRRTSSVELATISIPSIVLLLLLLLHFTANSVQFRFGTWQGLAGHGDNKQNLPQNVKRCVLRK